MPRLGLAVANNLLKGMLHAGAAPCAPVALHPPFFISQGCSRGSSVSLTCLVKIAQLICKHVGRSPTTWRAGLPYFQQSRIESYGQRATGELLGLPEIGSSTIEKYGAQIYRVLQGDETRSALVGACCSGLPCHGLYGMSWETSRRVSVRYGSGRYNIPTRKWPIGLRRVTLDSGRPGGNCWCSTLTMPPCWLCFFCAPLTSTGAFEAHGRGRASGNVGEARRGTTFVRPLLATARSPRFEK
jgi:hypothetical protein